MERKTTAREVKEYIPGQVIVKEGEKRECFFVILQGEVDVLQNQKSIRILKEGDIFGLENFFLKRAYTTTVQALSPVRVASYDSELMKEIIYTQPRLTEKILDSLVSQLEQTTQVAEKHISLENQVELPIQVFQDGEIIIKEGTPGIDFYRLMESEGGLSVIKGGKEIGRITEPGEYFGEMSSLLKFQRTATVKSIGRSEVKVFPGEKLEEILESYPQIAKNIIKTLALRLSEGDKKLVEDFI